MSNIYKIDNHYNTKSPWIPFHSQDRQKTSIRISYLSSKIAASLNMENKQKKLNQPIESSYHEKINEILTKWEQLQQEKKLCHHQTQLQQKPIRLCEGKKQEQQHDEFDRIMEEDLENQLKELERQEEEQYKLLEQMIEEQLEQDDKINPMDVFEEDHIEELKQIQKLETIIEEKQQRKDRQFKNINVWKRHEQLDDLQQLKKYQQQQQQSTKEQISKSDDLYDQKQQKIMNLGTWKQKHDIYLKQIMNRTNPTKMNKIIQLLKGYHQAKKYYVQLSK